MLAQPPPPRPALPRPRRRAPRRPRAARSPTRQRSAWASTDSTLPPCLRFSRSIASSRSSTAASRPGSASIPLQVVAQLDWRRRPARPRARRAARRSRRGRRRLPRRLQQRLGLGKGADRTAAAVLVGPGGARVGSRRRLAQPLGVAQPLALGRQLRLLGRVRRDLLDLRQLVAVEVEVALPRAVALAQLGQLGRAAARTRGARRGSAGAAPGARPRRSRRAPPSAPRRSSACGARAARRRRASRPPSSFRSEADAARPATKADVRPEAETRRPRTISSAPSGSRSATSAISGSSSSPAGRSKTPSTQASSAPGRTICGRALPPIRRSSECASTVLPAPVSPVIAFSPSPSRSSARSISSRFSIRSSRSTAPCLAAYPTWRAGPVAAALPHVPDAAKRRPRYGDPATAPPARQTARWPNFSRMRW